MDLSVQPRNRSYKPRLLKIKSSKRSRLVHFSRRKFYNFYKISNLKLSDNPFKTLKKKENTNGLGTKEVTLEL